MINQFIVIPFINILVVLYSLIPGHDFGLAVILFTIIIKIFLWPFASKALHGQKAMQELQPEVQKLQERYKNNKAEMNKAVMELYKEKEVNPFGSCLPTLIQLPFLFGIFYAFLKFKDPAFINLAEPTSGINTVLYSFVKNLSFVKNALSPENVFNTSLFGLINLAKPSVVIALLAAVSQFFQTKMLTPKKHHRDQAQQTMNQMTYMFPIITFVFGVTFPAALPLYWATQSFFSIFQQYWVMHRDVGFLEHLKNSVKK